MPRMTLPILYDDADLVAVSKPAGLAVIPGRGEGAGETVLELLAAQLGLPASGSVDPRLRVVHRLDKDTSGVLLFAKHAAAQRFLSHQFQTGSAAKEYVALVAGRPDGAEGEVDAPLAVHPTNPKKMHVATHGGRPARTAWRIEQPFRHVTLLRVFPRTGKTHQIRVHLRHVGLPLAIDPLYNPAAHREGILLSHFKRGYRPTRGERERPLIDRLTLHAERLTIIRPDGEPLALIAPLPKDLRATIAQLAKYDG